MPLNITTHPFQDILQLLSSPTHQYLFSLKKNYFSLFKTVTPSQASRKHVTTGWHRCRIPSAWPRRRWLEHKRPGPDTGTTVFLRPFDSKPVLLSSFAYKYAGSWIGVPVASYLGWRRCGWPQDHVSQPYLESTRQRPSTRACSSSASRQYHSEKSNFGIKPARYNIISKSAQPRG